jgi:hypothetical protein
MKVPISWLKEYIKTPFKVEDLAHRLNMAGTEVAAIVSVGDSWEGVTVGAGQRGQPPSQCRPAAAGNSGYGQRCFRGGMRSSECSQRAKDRLCL